MSDKSGVYAILTCSGAYVGSSITLRSRRGQHLGRLKSGIHPCRGLQSDYNEGRPFRFEILEECSKEILLQREAFWGEAIGLPILNSSKPGTKGKWVRPASVKEKVSKKAFQQWATPDRLRRKYAMLECIRLGMNFTTARLKFGFHHWTARKWVDEAFGR